MSAVNEKGPELVSQFLTIIQYQFKPADPSGPAV